jgi:hypothetical protein
MTERRPLLNYTTTVPAPRTVGEVQALLVEAGARSILLEYDGDGRASAVAFALDTSLGRRSFRLPADIDAVAKVLARDASAVKAHVNKRELASHAQAERVAWRVLKDWLEAQLALVRVNLAGLDQVMLPYMVAGDGRTVWDLYREHQLALPEAEP